MRGKHDAGEEDRLRALLRRGDPAADAAEGLPAHIAARMRARVVAATSDRHRPGFSPFVWATAAAAGIVVIVAIAVRPEAPPPPGPPELPASPPAVADAPPVAPAPLSTPVVTPPAEVQRGVSEAGTRSAPVASSPRAAPVVALPAASTPAVASTRKPLTVQFTTPAGTRIIWTLDPEFKG